MPTGSQQPDTENPLSSPSALTVLRRRQAGAAWTPLNLGGMLEPWAAGQDPTSILEDLPNPSPEPLHSLCAIEAFNFFWASMKQPSELELPAPISVVPKAMLIAFAKPSVFSTVWISIMRIKHGLQLPATASPCISCTCIPVRIPRKEINRAFVTFSLKKGTDVMKRQCLWHMPPNSCVS